MVTFMVRVGLHLSKIFYYWVCRSWLWLKRFCYVQCRTAPTTMLGKMLCHWYNCTILQRVWPIVLHDWSYMQRVWQITKRLTNHDARLTKCAVRLTKRCTIGNWSTGSTIDQVCCAIDQMLRNWPNAAILVKLINGPAHLVKHADWPNAPYIYILYC